MTAMETGKAPAGADAAPPAERASAKALAERFGLIAAWILVIALFGAMMPESYLTWINFSTMFSSQAVLVVLTLGLLIPLTAGDFDLSVASVMVLSAMSIAVLNALNGWPVGLAILFVLGLGVLVGLVNALFVLYFRIHSLIVTLGTGTFINGVVLWLSGSQTIGGVSMTLVDWVIVKRVFGISLSFYYALALAAALWWFLEYTSPGRRLLFVGRGREVARLSGIGVERVRMLSFVGSGVTSAFAGILYAGMTGSADPLSGLTYLLPAFAAAFLGATSINPGRFNAWGSVVAVYFLVSGITGLTILGVDTYVQNLFYGGGLVIAVALSQLVRKRQPQTFS